MSTENRHEFNFLKVLKNKGNKTLPEESNSKEAIAKNWDAMFAKFSRKKRK